MIYGFRFMIYESPLDGGYLLDADGDEGYFPESGCVQDEDTAGLKHLEIRYAELVIAISTLLFVPDNHSAAGMDTLDGLTFQHRTSTRRMETMIVKHIKDDMRRLAAGKGIPIGAIAEQIQPIIYRGRLNWRKSDLPVAGGEKLRIEN